MRWRRTDRNSARKPAMIIIIRLRAYAPRTSPNLESESKRFRCFHRLNAELSWPGCQCLQREGRSFDDDRERSTLLPYRLRSAVGELDKIVSHLIEIVAGSTGFAASINFMIDEIQVLSRTY